LEPRITVITLAVADLERAVRFYRDGLDLPLREPASPVAYFALSGSWLALYPRVDLAEYAGVPEAGSGFSGVTLSHNVGKRDEVGALLRQAEAAGAKVVKEPGPASWGGHVAWFADPDGHLWEIVWNPKLSSA